MTGENLLTVVEEGLRVKYFNDKYCKNDDAHKIELFYYEDDDKIIVGDFLKEHFRLEMSDDDIELHVGSKYYFATTHTVMEYHILKAHTILVGHAMTKIARLIDIVDDLVAVEKYKFKMIYALTNRVKREIMAARTNDINRFLARDVDRIIDNTLGEIITAWR